MEIFLFQPINNVTGLGFPHSNEFTAVLCRSWKHLARLELSGSFFDEIVNLNPILDGLPNLEYLFCSQKCEFASTDQIYPKMEEIHLNKLTTSATDLLNSLPNLQTLKLLEIQLNFEILRKIASMNLRELKIHFIVQTETLETTENEYSMHLDQIFQKIPKIDIKCSQKITSYCFRNVDYIYGEVRDVNCDYLYRRTFPTHKDFPF
jgi:hypothetical protein